MGGAQHEEHDVNDTQSPTDRLVLPGVEQSTPARVCEVEIEGGQCGEPFDGWRWTEGVNGEDGTLRQSCAEHANEAGVMIGTYEALCSRQSRLLTATVNALRGDPPSLWTWSHHDVHELAARLKAEVESLRPLRRDGGPVEGGGTAQVVMPHRMPFKGAWHEKEVRGLARWADDTGSGEASDLLNALADALRERVPEEDQR